MKKLIAFALFAALTACSNNTNPPAEPAPKAAEPSKEAAPPAEPVVPASTTPSKEPPPPEPVATTAPKGDTKANKAVDAKANVPPVPTNQGKIFVRFQTNMGNFTAELNDKEAPITVANFIGLAGGTVEFTDPKSGQKQKKPYYDGLTFHRVIGSRKMAPDGFMIQGGDPLGNGTGGPGFTIKDEYNSLRHDKPGTLAMARTGAPDSAGSQFYITLGAPTFLDGQRPPYVVFGQIVEGLDVVKKIGEVQTDPSDKPLSPVIMNKVTVERK